MDIRPIYQYIASTDPYTAKAICNKFGFDASQAQTEMEVAACLQDVVAAHGEEALIAIVDIHPDKDLILELLGKKAEPGEDQKKDVTHQYVQSAAEAVHPSPINGNTFIIGAVVILGLAIVFSKSSKS